MFMFGFLMAGSEFGFDEWLLFVTNADVISDTWGGVDFRRRREGRLRDRIRSYRVPVPHAVERIVFTSTQANSASSRRRWTNWMSRLFR